MRLRLSIISSVFAITTLVFSGSIANAVTTQSDWTAATSFAGKTGSSDTMVATPEGNFLSIVTTANEAIQIVESTDGGQTWNPGPVLAQNLGQYASGWIATNGEGTYLATWTSRSSLVSSVRVDASISTDGLTWQSPHNLVSAQQGARGDVLTVSPDGDAVVATAGAFYRYHSGTWTSTVSGGEIYQVAAGSDGRYIAAGSSSGWPSATLYSSADGVTWTSSSMASGKAIDTEVAPVALSGGGFIVAGSDITGTSPNYHYSARAFTIVVNNAGVATVSDSGQIVSGNDESSFSSLVQTVSGELFGLILGYSASTNTGPLSVYTSGDGQSWSHQADLTQANPTSLEHVAKLGTDGNGNLVAAIRDDSVGSEVVRSWSSTDAENWSAATTHTTTATACSGPRPPFVIASTSGNFVVGWTTDVNTGQSCSNVNVQSFVNTSSAMFSSAVIDDLPITGEPVAGQTVAVSLTGLRPGSALTLEAHSTPVTFGNAVAGASGSATVSGALPSLGVGSHSIYLVGTWANGTQFSQLLSSFYVSPNGTVIDEPTALAATGADLNLVGVLIGLTSASGLALILVSRRIAARRAAFVK
ncbi:MAG: sialidase family protein [Microbacteriaceae bacterium]